jgi:hypothetical protein
MFLTAKMSVEGRLIRSVASQVVRSVIVCVAVAPKVAPPWRVHCVTVHIELFTTTIEAVVLMVSPRWTPEARIVPFAFRSPRV